MPYMPYQPGCGGLLITLGAIFLLLLVVGKFFRLWAWRAGGEPGMMTRGEKSEHWAKHWHRHRPHGPMPPWCWGWEEPSEEKAEKPEPDTEVGDAAGEAAADTNAEAGA
jgi:hypothetical protein